MVDAPLRIPGCNKHVVFQLFTVSQRGQEESWCRSYYDHDLAIEMIRQHWSKMRVYSYCRVILLEANKAVGWVGELTSKTRKFSELKSSEISPSEAS